MSDYYQDRSVQAHAMARARHWLERLAQLAQFENIVLRTTGRGRGEGQGGPGADPQRKPPQPEKRA